MRTALPIALTVAAVFAIPVTFAALEDDLRNCASQEDDEVRLACYDALADETATDSSPANPDSDFGGESAFGLTPEPVENEPDRIVSRHVGEFRGWSGQTLFHLENGQVWRQAEPGRVDWIVDRPVITIRKNRFGSFWLGVDGINAEVRVRRVE